MKRRVAICIGCGNKKEIYALKRCVGCYQDHKRQEYYSKAKKNPIVKKSPIKKGWTKKAKAQIKSDNEFYDLIWSKRVHRCDECGCALGSEWRRFHFSHILSKGAYPQLRHDEENVDLLCLQHHTQWEFGRKEEMKIWKKNEPLIMKLKAKANSKH